MCLALYASVKMDISIFDNYIFGILWAMTNFNTYSGQK